MKRLTYDFCVGDKHCWQVKGADDLECSEVCRNQGENGCTDCPIANAFDRLAAYEETGLEPEEIMEAVKLFSGTNVDVSIEQRRQNRISNPRSRRCRAEGKGGRP